MRQQTPCVADFYGNSLGNVSSYYTGFPDKQGYQESKMREKPGYPFRVRSGRMIPIEQNKYCYYRIFC
jgi:hypothetical protein